MPYSSNADIPASVKKRLKSPKKQRQWRHVWNSAYKRTGSESRAFAMANAVASKEAYDALSVADKAYVSSWDVEKRQIPQDVAEYNPLGATGTKGCANCQWFISPNCCVLVAGEISPTGISKYYTPQYEYETPPLPVYVTNWEDDEEYKELTPTLEKPNILTQIWQAAKSAVGVKQQVAQPKPFFLYDGPNGELRWFAVYSNNFEDKHTQILTDAAHKEYAEWVNDTKQYSDLHIWHCGDGSKYGKTDFVDYVDGFAMASGIIDAGKEPLARAIAETNPGVSHGFVGVHHKATGEWSKYRQFEISTLPLEAAANVTLDVVYEPGSKELLMPFAPDKRAHLKALGFTDETITEWEGNIKAQGDYLKAHGVNFKSEVMDEETGTETEAKPEGEASTMRQDTSNVATKSELSFMLKAQADNAKILSGVVASVNTLAEGFKTLAASVEELKKPVDQRIADENLARLQPQGANGAKAFVATESNTNVATKEEAKVDNDWWNQISMGQVEKQLGTV